MPRSRICRCVERAPRVTYFKPRGIPMYELTQVVLSVEGLEAIRLADIEGLTTEKAAQRMRVSRHTFGRILNEGRRIVADALIHGRALCIEGGTYVVDASGNDAAVSKERDMRRIAVSSEGPGLDSMVDPRFGRAGGFVIVDSETMDVEYIDNGESQIMAQGAGISSAEKLANSGADVILSGYIGPKAFEALTAAGIKICQDMDGMTVGEAVERFKSGSVPFSQVPNK